MHIKPRAIATVLCMIFFIGFAVCGVVRSTDKETSEIRQSYPVLAEAEPVIMADLLMESPDLEPGCSEVSPLLLSQFKLTRRNTKMSKTGFAMFLAGATVGAAATWLCLRRYYEQITQEEIDSVKAAFAERKPVIANIAKDEKSNEKQEENQHKADIAKLKPDLVNYAAKLQEEGYTNYTEHSKKNTEEKKDEPMPNEPYVISPDDYGENDNYTQISLVYYAGDGVLADDEDEVVEDIEDTVGEDFAEHFGEYEDDSVFIRNDRLRCDYEILRDNRSFSDVAEGSNY